MNYNLLEIDEVKAVKVSGNFKSDVQVQINVCIKLKNTVDIQNIKTSAKTKNNLKRTGYASNIKTVQTISH